MAYEPERWHDLFVMLGSASAALAGLVFVGLSLHARAVAVDHFYRLRARNLTAGIAYVLIASVLVLMPGQGLGPLGSELIVGGVVLAALFAEVPVRYWARLDAEMRVRMVVATAACLASAYAGISLIARGGGGLYVLAAAGIAGVVMNVFGAWSLLLGLARER